LYTNAQIKLFKDEADKSVVYFDPTGSLLRQQTLRKDYQIPFSFIILWEEVFLFLLRAM